MTALIGPDTPLGFHEFVFSSRLSLNFLFFLHRVSVLDYVDHGVSVTSFSFFILFVHFYFLVTNDSCHIRLSTTNLGGFLLR